MAYYRVKVTEKSEAEYLVEADSVEEAENKAWDLFDMDDDRGSEYEYETEEMNEEDYKFEKSLEE